MDAILANNVGMQHQKHERIQGVRIMNEVTEIKNGQPRAIKVTGQESLDDIMANSTHGGERPDGVLVWRNDGGWDLYCYGDAEIPANNAPVPPDSKPDPKKMKIESLIAMKANPRCFCLNGVWHWI